MPGQQQSSRTRPVARTAEQQIGTLINRYVLQQADPAGRPSHGRHFDLSPILSALDQIDPQVIRKLLDSPQITNQIKGNLLIQLADIVRLGEQDTELPNLIAWINSLDRAGLPAYPIWCLPNYARTLINRRTAEAHYRKRLEAMLMLGQAGNGTSELYHFVEHYRDYLYINNKCLCDLLAGRGIPTFRPIKEQRTAVGAGKIGRAYPITDLEGHPYIMKSIAGIDPASKITLSLLPAVPHNPVTSAISNGGYYVAAGSDNFTNQTIMHLILGAVLGDCPHYVYQYDAFICDTVGVNIMEVANRGDLYRYLTQLATTKERLDACGECLRQILPVLMLLKRLGFMHNDLKLKNIFVHQPEPAGPVIYLLADFDKSAISWKTVRFYNNNNGLDLVSSTVALAVEYHKYGADQLKPGLIAGFSGMKLAGQSLAPYIMHNAAGYYLGYDIYTLVFSMLCYPGLFLAVESDHNSPMYRIFRALSRIDQAKSGTQKSGVYEDRPELRDALQKAIHQQKTNPEALQSISIINAYLHDGRVFIRNDLRALLAELGLDVYHTAEEKVLAVALDRSHKPILSKNGHLCLTAPAQKSCRTIPYRSWGLLYETDQVAGGGGRRRKN